jgi:hypothetical protein
MREMCNTKIIETRRATRISNNSRQITHYEEMLAKNKSENVYADKIEKTVNFR